MILVLLGTQDKSFVRLLKAVEQLVIDKKIKEKVIVQAGYTKYESKHIEIFDFVSSDEVKQYVEEASIIITHGGVGSILDGISKGKKMIVAPRLKEYKEHTNDHQLQIIKRFADMNYIIPLLEFDKLDLKIEETKKFKPKKYKGSNKKMISLIENYIDNL